MEKVCLQEIVAQLANHLTTNHKVKGLNLAITGERFWCTYVAHLVEGFNPNQMIKGSNLDTSQHRNKKAEKVCLQEIVAQLANHLITDHKVKGLHIAITGERSWCILGNHLVEGFNRNEMIKGSNPDTSQHWDKKAERVCFGRNIGTVSKPFNYQSYGQGFKSSHRW